MTTPSIDSIDVPPAAATTATTVADPEPTTDLCSCGHPTDGHDRIALRFCAATVSGHMDRGCVCVVTAPQPLDRRSGSNLVQ